jgi:UDP-N-acetylglucosamine:LPS N-acetylglucosamine transferase
LVRASHAAIGKAGYSTVAEAYHAGLPFSFIHRPQFRESEVMASFITKEMAGVEMPQADFYSGNWSIFLSGLNKSLRKATHRINGAEAVASFILDRVR